MTHTHLGIWIYMLAGLLTALQGLRITQRNKGDRRRTFDLPITVALGGTIVVLLILAIR